MNEAASQLQAMNLSHVIEEYLEGRRPRGVGITARSARMRRLGAMNTI